jgi:hypothetical protein
MTKEKENDPLKSIVVGATGTIFGFTMAFKKLVHIKNIKNLWKQNTTLKKLEDLAKHQQKLPKVCIIPGILKSNEFIKPLLFETPQLLSNFKNKEILNQQILISEVLVTRLSCKIVRTKDKTERKKRGTRTNVHFESRISKNIQLESSCGNHSAFLEFPDTSRVLSHGEDPSLFLTVENAQFGFDNQNEKTIEGSKYEHLSKFIYLDVETKNETEFFSPIDSIPFNILKEIGEKSTSKDWKWIPKTFYDGDLPKWGKWLTTETVTFKEYFDRVSEAAELHIKNAIALFDISKSRSEENGYRIVSLAIPNNEKVTIVAKPTAIIGNDGNVSIQLNPIEETEKEFKFRILKGHDISNLVLHSKKGFNLYIFFAFTSLLLFLKSFYDLLREHSPGNVRQAMDWVINRIKMAIMNAWRKFTGFAFGK